MYTIDTSVWVSATEPTDSGYDDCRKLIAELRRRTALIIVPTLLRVEIAGAVSRLRTPTRAAQVLAIFDRLPGITLVPLDGSGSNLAAQLARIHRLRGADAVYAALAQQHSTTLISRDREHLTRLAGIVPVLHPAALLAALIAPP